MSVRASTSSRRSRSGLIYGSVPDDGAGPGEIPSPQLDDAEVQYLDDALGRDHHVRRLDVAMDDAALVRVREPLRDLPCDADGLDPPAADRARTRSATVSPA